MRVRRTVGFLMGSPAAGAALVLAIFAATGLLIVIAGPIGPQAPTTAPTAPRNRTPLTRVPPPAWVSALAHAAAGDLEVLSSPDQPTTPGEVRARVDAITMGPIARSQATQLLLGQAALAQNLARRAPDAVLATIPVGYAIHTAHADRASVQLWSIVLAGNAAIGVTNAWASNTLEMVWDGGAWRLAGMTPLASGPAPQTSPPAQSATVEAAAIAGFTPLAP